MATEAEIRNLRARADSILRKPACNSIRFRLDNVTLHTFMYGYIGHAIANDRVHIRIDGNRGDSYDPGNDTITFGSTDIPDYTIVHEATHAIIDATHSGKTVTVAAGEAVAYVAESLYALNAGHTSHTIDDPRLMRTAYTIARQIRAFNASQSTGVFTVAAGDVTQIKSDLAGSGLRQAFSHGFVQDGIYEGPRRGLIGMMFIESRK